MLLKSLFDTCGPVTVSVNLGQFLSKIKKRQVERKRIRVEK